MLIQCSRMNAVHFTYLARLPDERGNSVKFSEEGEGPRATRFFDYYPPRFATLRTLFFPVYIISFSDGNSSKTFDFRELLRALISLQLRKRIGFSMYIAI